MSEIRHWGKEFLSSFIEEYKRNPCLWKVKAKAYTNRNLKNIAYNKLVEISKSVYEDANREWVVSRIQSIRGSFRKENRKVMESKKNAISVHDIYIPNLWYYDMLLFTQDQDSNEDNIPNYCEAIEYEECSTSNTDDIDVHQVKEEVEEDQDSEVELGITSITRLKADQVSDPPVDPLGQNKRTNNGVAERDYKDYAKKIKYSDEYDLMGAIVATKLKKMNSNQQIHAESLIYQILTKGLLNTLTDSTAIH